MKIRCGTSWCPATTSLLCAWLSLIATGLCVAAAYLPQSACGVSDLQDESVHNMWRAHGATNIKNLSECRIENQNTAKASGYIAGPFGCTGDYSEAIGECIDEGTVTAGFVAYLSGHGPNTAYSNHSFTVGSTTVNMNPKSKNIYAKSDEDVCEEDPNGDWDPTTENCTYNPDPESPIVIATSRGSKYKMTSAQDGVLFDIDADGNAERVAWTEADESVAFLALDRNGDGIINNGRELFGNNTEPGAKNGFEALLRLSMASNGGVMRASVSEDDPLFGDLRLWTDKNHNGMSEPDELRPVSEMVAEIALGYQDHHKKDGHGNLFRYRGWVFLRTAPGRNRVVSLADNNARLRFIYDVYLQVAR